MASRSVSLNTWNILFHILLVSIVFGEKSAVIQIVFPLLIIILVLKYLYWSLCCFSLIAKVFSDVFSFQFDYLVFGCRFLWVYLFWSSLSLFCGSVYDVPFRKFSAILVSLFLSLLLGFWIIQMSDHFSYSHRSLVVSSLFKSIPPTPVFVISVDTSVISILLSVPPMEAFLPVIRVFHSQISVLFLFSSNFYFL